MLIAVNRLPIVHVNYINVCLTSSEQTLLQQTLVDVISRLPSSISTIKQEQSTKIEKEKKETQSNWKNYMTLNP
jgi:hypothetical protein